MSKCVINIITLIQPLLCAYTLSILVPDLARTHADKIIQRHYTLPDALIYIITCSRFEVTMHASHASTRAWVDRYRGYGKHKHTCIRRREMLMMGLYTCEGVERRCLYTRRDIYDGHIINISPLICLKVCADMMVPPPLGAHHQYLSPDMFVVMCMCRHPL